MKKLHASLVILMCIFLFYPVTLQAQENSDSRTVMAIDRLGFEMVFVPSGTVQMGIDVEVFRDLIANGVFAEFGGERLVSLELGYGVFETYEITLQEFWVDRYEVTIDQYERIYHQCFSTNTCPDSNLPQLLTWDEAVRFCAGRGARLLSEEEWEYVASGSENFIFPWGNEFTSEFSNNPDYLSFTMYDVGTRQHNVSWIGVFDMAGNAEEWTNDLYRPYYSWNETEFVDWHEIHEEFSRVLRGGQSVDSIHRKTTYSRQGGFYGTAGVRCARFSHPEK